MNTIYTPSNALPGVTRFPMSGSVAPLTTMSSLDIAKITGKRHPDVTRDIVAMLLDLKVDVSTFAHIYRDSMKREQKEYLLDREHTDCLLTGYSAEMRMKVIRRWRELEEKAADAGRVPTNFLEALRLAADQVEQNQHLKLVILAQTPKVEALNRLANTRGSLCITDAAKHLGISPLQLFAWMSTNRWIYRRTSHAPWSAFQPRLSRGQLEHKLVKINKSEAEELKVVEQVMVTRLGLVALAEQITGGAE